jgi:hypothetical protein
MAAKLLLHGCCAHCTAYSFKYWQEQGFEVSVYWYNPNIHPFTEHQNRLEAMVKLSQELSFELVTEPLYQMAEYFKKVAEKPDERCRTCFDMRLGQTMNISLPAFLSAPIRSIRKQFFRLKLLPKKQGSNLLMQTSGNVIRTAGILPSRWTFIASSTAGVYTASMNGSVKQTRLPEDTIFILFAKAYMLKYICTICQRFL